MPYGIIKVDTITFTDNNVDKIVSISGLVQNPTFTGNVTATGTISGTTITGTTVAATTGTFTSLTGTTTTGTTANFASGVFTTQVSGATIIAPTGTFTSLTGTTTTGTTANFVSGVFSTRVSGVTITGTTGNFTTLNATTINGTVSGYGALDTAQTWTKGQRGEITVLTDGATITADLADSNNFSVTLGGNRTLANPSNQTAGQSGCIWITQDGTGSRTLAYGSQWDFTGGTAPTLSTAAAAVDCLAYAVQSSTKITATLITNLS